MSVASERYSTTLGTLEGRPPACGAYSAYSLARVCEQAKALALTALV